MYGHTTTTASAAVRRALLACVFAGTVASGAMAESAGPLEIQPLLQQDRQRVETLNRQQPQFQRQFPGQPSFGQRARGQAAWSAQPRPTYRLAPRRAAPIWGGPSIFQPRPVQPHLFDGRSRAQRGYAERQYYVERRHLGQPEAGATWDDGVERWQLSEPGYGEAPEAGQELHQPLPDAAAPLEIYSDAPQERFIDGLEKALEVYATIAAKGGWGTVPAGRSLKPGMRDPRVPALRYRLAITGELPAAQANRSTTYDAGLHVAVQRFQERHGLAPDGVVGPDTVDAMNVPVEARISQIEANMERWRGSAPELSARYVLVNVPAYEMQVMEGDTAVMRMEAVVGRPSRPTPIFSDRITYLEFQPYWNVPESIVRRDLVPAFIENASYATDQNFEIVRGGEIRSAATVDWRAYRNREVPFLIRQAPGPTNALGNVKFMLPNRHNVYLHDTPAQYLFLRAKRAESSGCVRLERPREFAHYLLADKPGWTPERIDAALDGEETMQVPLAKPVPVHFIYMTAWVDRQGTVHLREDLYGKDGGAVATASAE
jgi:peptidoglycan hydrolase-like protein with peptidoglycan-binding domain